MADILQNAREMAREVIRFCDGAAANPAEYGTAAAELADLRAFAHFMRLKKPEVTGFP